METRTAIVLGPNRVDAVDVPVRFSGGLWRHGRRPENLRDRSLGVYARAMMANAHAQRFVVDLGALCAIKGVVLPGSWTGEPLISARISRAADFGSIEASIADDPVFYEVTPPDASEFEDEEFWTGQMTAAERLLFPVPWIWLPEPTALGRYIEITIKGGGGLLRRLFVASGWAPVHGFDYGAEILPVDETIRVPSFGGGDVYDIRPRRRTVTVSFSHIAKNEALKALLDRQMQDGISGQLFFCWYVKDRPNLPRLSFLCTAERMSAIRAVYAGHMASQLAFREVIR